MFVAALVSASTLGGMAHAATIDFSGFASGDSGLSVLVVDGHTFSVPGGTVWVYRPGDFGAFTDSGGVCALGGGTCENDWSLTFSGAVTNLEFEAAFFDAGDSTNVQAFDGAVPVGLLAVAADGTYGFGGATITSLSFDDFSTGAGFGFGDFAFDFVGTEVPAPPAVLMLGVGLAGLLLRRRAGAR
jgi:hypothetical protein